MTEKPRKDREPDDEEQRRFEEDEAALRADPHFEEIEEELEEGVTEVILPGEWIPGARRPKESDE